MNFCITDNFQGMHSVLKRGVTILKSAPKYDAVLTDMLPSIFRKEFSNASVLHVFFRDITCMKYARDAYMTWDAVFGKLI
jgi:hypothetical protein